MFCPDVGSAVLKGLRSFIHHSEMFLSESDTYAVARVGYDCKTVLQIGAPLKVR